MGALPADLSAVHRLQSSGQPPEASFSPHPSLPQNHGDSPRRKRQVDPFKAGTSRLSTRMFMNINLFNSSHFPPDPFSTNLSSIQTGGPSHIRLPRSPESPRSPCRSATSAVQIKSYVQARWTPPPSPHRYWRLSQQRQAPIRIRLRIATRIGRMMRNLRRFE